ncbi:glycosyltransferase-like protein [Selaginella moellendorffii]|uniref:Glycosyltransferase-like protein n=1 Tax=Selaginella moellendorffii TaxID=88036 RepID=D8RRC1_SELML|nr:uncharacterized protein LOC9642624 [Selaginella moellendorffii]EFJ25373.1 glycosyltransferase-like protein [Selaginella moellendorffii]|eukprot:XP_002973713.1 uncharacterized protein LOC9642624 [Selaginella moellendorffii]
MSMDSYKKQQQMKSLTRQLSEHSALGLGMSKLALVVCAACACSFFYVALLLLSSASMMASCIPSSSHGSTTSSRIMPYNFALLGSSNATTAASSRFTLNLDQEKQRYSSTSPRKSLQQASGSRTSASQASGSTSSSTSAADSALVSSIPAKVVPKIGPHDAAQVEIPSTTIAKTEIHTTTTATTLYNIVFGIAASSRLWDRRREYVKLWWKSSQMRGFVWLDKKVRRKWSKTDYPPFRISSSTAAFNYTNKMGARAAIRISRIVSETFRIGLPDVHWFVMGDDDTIFIPENLVKLLSKYDHTKYYYIGSSSESHTQNLHFSYNMAYGGGGFAISYPLARALERMQDGCLHRYPYLFGSDDRIQACMAELGVPLVKEPGFHQFDIYGDASGLLSAHPVSPLISIHHLDVIHPIFPNMTQVQALKHLSRSIKVDAPGILQQSICYDKWRKWSFSVSWGYAVQVYRGILPPRELELPARTFISWYRRTEDSGFPFSTREISRNPCEPPTIFYMDNVGHKNSSRSYSTYARETKRRGDCRWKMASPGGIDSIMVYRDRTEGNWHTAPRRHCCRVINSDKRNVEIEVGQCRTGEFIA